MKTFTLENDAGYKAAMIKCDALENQLAEQKKRLNELIALRIQGLEAPRMGIMRDADAILEGKPLPAANASEEELDHLRRIIRALETAIESQRRAVSEEVTRASKAVAPEVTKQYAALIQCMAKTLTEAARACEEEENFRDQLDSAGLKIASAGISPQPFSKLGRLSQDWSDVSLWLREAKQSGHLK